MIEPEFHQLSLKVGKRTVKLMVFESNRPYCYIKVSALTLKHRCMLMKELEEAGWRFITETAGAWICSKRKEYRITQTFRGSAHPNAVAQEFANTLKENT